MEREPRIVRLYRHIEGPRETVYPPDYRVVAGAVDTHIHAGAGVQDPWALGRFAVEAGIRAMVFKSSLMPTVELARTLTNAIGEWAEARGKPPVQFFGGVVMGPNVGGVNVDYARRMVDAGARIIWLPTLQSANHLAKIHGMSWDEAQRVGTSVLDGDRPRHEVMELIDLAAKSNVALSFGHANREETLALADVASAKGFDKALIDHPFNPVCGLSVDDVAAVAAKGVTINLTYSEFSPLIAADPADMVAALRRAGVARVIMSSDSAGGDHPDAVTSMSVFARLLRAQGVSADDLHQMMVVNPSRLINLDDGQPGEGA